MMAETMAMPAPAMPQPTTMSLSEAMDTLDEFHIKRSDYDRVMAAMEIVFGGSDEAEPAADADNAPQGDEAVAKEMFATGRNRKEA